MKKYNKKDIAIEIYTLKPGFNNKYFYIKILEKLFNIHNKKNLIKIPNS